MKFKELRETIADLDIELFSYDDIYDRKIDYINADELRKESVYDNETINSIASGYKSTIIVFLGTQEKLLTDEEKWIFAIEFLEQEYGKNYQEQLELKGLKISVSEGGIDFSYKGINDYILYWSLHTKNMIKRAIKRFIPMLMDED